MKVLRARERRSASGRRAGGVRGNDGGGCPNLNRHRVASSDLRKRSKSERAEIESLLQHTCVEAIREKERIDKYKL